MTTPGSLLTLTVDRPAVGGAMIARVEGRIVLVSGAIPGERVTARVDRTSKGVAFATTVSVDEASSDRRPGFADPLCGGCAYSHIAYDRQRAIKAQVVADAFARIARVELPAVVDVRPSPETGYRMRARLHARGGRLGFFREGTHGVCDPRQSRQLLDDSCDALDRVAAAMRSLGDTVREVELSENMPASERVVHLETARPVDSRALDALKSVAGLTPSPYVSDDVTIGDRSIRLRRHVLAFFQGNRYLLRELVEYVVNLVEPGSEVLDLYAGAGLFSVAMASFRSASVTAVEGDRYASDDLRANCAAAGGDLTAIRSDVESAVVALRNRGPRETSAPSDRVVVVDPPRTGLSPDARDGVIQLAPRRIVYVSCDVATLARDSRAIVDAGYSIERVKAFDLFPNTPHVETVVTYSRR
jgi:tRNA/tmRNA/rRNA uracil-C5-methylase (TrmA/RlmC/RlmD family)